MGKQSLVKFRHENFKGIFHYVVFEDEFVALSEVNTGKIKYIKSHGALDVSFDLKSESYDIMSCDVIEDKEFVQKVYDFMLNQDNTYFKNGIEGLCVLKFHK